MVIFAQINTGKMTKNIPQFLIAAPTSGSGKTTVSRGLMALLKARGLNVQPYNVGRTTSIQSFMNVPADVRRSI